MNFLIGIIGANFTFGLLSGLTTALNSAYSLTTVIATRTSNGADDIKNTIKDSDIENKLKIIQHLLQEIKINQKTPNTMIECINSINDVIKELTDELQKINYRMNYNDRVWLPSVRAYSFKNSNMRLLQHIKKLDSRYLMLLEILRIENMMYKNSDINIIITKPLLLTNAECDIDNDNNLDINKQPIILTKCDN